MQHIEIYTDGSAAKARSGWGFVAVVDNKIITKAQSLPKGTTNQHAELVAALQALDWWREHYHDVSCTIYSDSAYLVNCYIDGWWKNWVNNGWYNTSKQPVVNKEVWQLLVPYFTNPYVHICKVTAHVGHTYNELADKLARGIAVPNFQEEINLTKTNKYDIISIELSNILLGFHANKKSYNETIHAIMNIMIREGVQMDGEYYSNTDN